MPPVLQPFSIWPIDRDVSVRPTLARVNDLQEQLARSRMEKEDRAVDRFRRQVAFVGLGNGQTIDVRIVDDYALTQSTLAGRRLRSQDVARERLAANDLAGTGFLEALGRAFVRFHFRHGILHPLAGRRQALIKG